MGGGEFCNQALFSKFHLDTKRKDLLTFFLGAGWYQREYEVLPQLLSKAF